MNKKDPIFNIYEKSPSNKVIRLALAINSVKPGLIELNQRGYITSPDYRFEKVISPVIECIFEWLKDHPVQLHYFAVSNDSFKYIDGFIESIDEYNDVSQAVMASYSSNDNNQRELIYFQCRNGLAPEDRCWMIMNSGGFCGCTDPNLLYQSPDVWNFVTDDPAGMLQYISERTGNPIIGAKGSAPWSFENLVLINGESNDCYAAITASTERVFDKLPKPIYRDGDPVSIS